MASSRRVVTYAGAVSEALKKHHGSRIGAERSLDSLLPSERTRIFDSNAERQVNINDAVGYFSAVISDQFGKQMIGKKSMTVNLKAVSALLEIIHHAAKEFLFKDMVIVEELGKVVDPVVRAQCERDLVVAFTNTALGKVNTDAAMAASLEPDTDAYLQASSYRAFCLVVTNNNNMKPEDVLTAVQDGARAVVKDSMMHQLGIVKHDDGSLTIPEGVVDRIKSVDYKMLVKQGVVAKNMPLLQENSDKAFKRVMYDVIAHVYRELKKRSIGEASKFLAQFDKKTREYVDTHISIRFASQSGSTQGVFGVSVPAARAAAAAAPSSASSSSSASSTKKGQDSPRSYTQRIATPRKASLFADTVSSSDVQKLDDEKRPLERADSMNITHRKLHK